MLPKAMQTHTIPRTLDRFVAFESLDGAGTSTQLRLLDSALSELGLPHWITAEPTALPSGTLIRQALRGDFEAEAGTIARLFAADRYQHLHGAGQILDHLAAGELVLSDRYLFSSLAYQGEACGDDSPWQLNKDFPLPALVLFFEIDPAVALARIASRSEHDIYETLEFQRRLSAAYERAFAAWPEGSFALVRIDASLPQAEVGRAVQAALASHGLVNR